MALTYLANLSFPAARTALNAVFNSVDTWNAGATEPAEFQAFTPWLDTSGVTPILKIRNAANSAWVNVLAYQGDDASLAPWLIDEDDMASDLATQVPSQQSVKAYADTLHTAKNVFVNGNMAIDQRNEGASQTIVAAATKAYTVDRWYAYCTGANVTGQRVAGGGQSQYRYRFTGAASNTAIQFGQRIEATHSYHLNGQTATLSVDLANSLLTTVSWTAYYANTTDTFGTIASPTRTLIDTGTFTVNSTVTRYSTQIAIPVAATTGIEIVFSVANQTSGTWTIGDAQLELGAIATDFERRDNFTLCLRRFEKGIAQGSTNDDSIFNAGGIATVAFPFKITMASTPTIVARDSAGTANRFNTSLNLGGSANQSILGGTLTGNASIYGFACDFTSTAGTNRFSYYFEASCEL